MNNQLVDLLIKNKDAFYPVISFETSEDSFVSLDLTVRNEDLTEKIINDIDLFQGFINEHIANNHALYAIGGYLEYRDLYSRSEVFDGKDQDSARRLHLGVDIWGKAGTAVFSPLEGIVHSAAMNEAKGDYGATIILKHELEGFHFHTLYGHLSKADLCLTVGDKIKKGQQLAHFGGIHENGYWPPHLHFQVIIDMDGWVGDYPGVCSKKDRSYYEANCPDPNLILKFD